MKTPHPTRLIVLDRDGTINQERDDFVKSPDEWEPLPGALQAIARLNHAGWKTVLATNQSGIGRGLFDMEAFNAIHLKMNTLMAKAGARIDAVFFCPHRPEDACACRKPLPGLILDVVQRFNVDPVTLPVVGDSLRDLQAALAAGAKPHLVRTGRGARTERADVYKKAPGVLVHDDLAAFAEYLINQERLMRAQSGKASSGFGRLD